METKPTWHGIDRSDIPWYPTVDTHLCIGCELCFVTCGKSVYQMKEEGTKHKAAVFDPYACVVGCTTCANICPTHAISFPDPIIVLNVEKEHKIFSKVHKEADSKREKQSQRHDALKEQNVVGREVFEIAGEIEKLINMSALRDLVIPLECDLIDISISIPSVREHIHGAPGIAKMTLIGPSQSISEASRRLNELIGSLGLSISKHD